MQGREDSVEREDNSDQSEDSQEEDVQRRMTRSQVTRELHNQGNRQRQQPTGAAGAQPTGNVANSRKEAAKKREEEERVKKREAARKKKAEAKRNKKEAVARGKRDDGPADVETSTSRRSKSNSPPFQQSWSVKQEFTGGRYASRRDGRSSERQTTVSERDREDTDEERVKTEEEEDRAESGTDGAQPGKASRPVTTTLRFGSAGKGAPYNPTRVASSMGDYVEDFAASSYSGTSNKWGGAPFRTEAESRSTRFKNMLGDTADPGTSSVDPYKAYRVSKETGTIFQDYTPEETKLLLGVGTMSGMAPARSPSNAFLFGTTRMGPDERKIRSSPYSDGTATALGPEATTALELSAMEMDAMGGSFLDQSVTATLVQSSTAASSLTTPLSTGAGSGPSVMSGPSVRRRPPQRKRTTASAPTTPSNRGSRGRALSALRALYEGERDQMREEMRKAGGDTKEKKKKGGPRRSKKSRGRSRGREETEEADPPSPPPPSDREGKPHESSSGKGRIHGTMPHQSTKPARGQEHRAPQKEQNGDANDIPGVSVKGSSVTEVQDHTEVTVVDDEDVLETETKQDEVVVDEFLANFMRDHELAKEPDTESDSGGKGNPHEDPVREIEKERDKKRWDKVFGSAYEGTEAKRTKAAEGEGDLDKKESKEEKHGKKSVGDGVADEDPVRKIEKERDKKRREKVASLNKRNELRVFHRKLNETTTTAIERLDDVVLAINSTLTHTRQVGSEDETIGVEVTEADKYAALMRVIPLKERTRLLGKGLTTYSLVRKFMKEEANRLSYSASFSTGTHTDELEESEGRDFIRVTRRSSKDNSTGVGQLTRRLQVQAEISNHERHDWDTEVKQLRDKAERALHLASHAEQEYTNLAYNMPGIIARQLRRMQAEADRHGRRDACHNCGAADHWARECLQKRMCWVCGSNDHNKMHCEHVMDNSRGPRNVKLMSN
jgi:hypothetical protein